MGFVFTNGKPKIERSAGKACFQLLSEEESGTVQAETKNGPLYQGKES